MPSVALYRGLLRASVAQALVYRGQIVIFLVGALFPLVMMTVWLTLIGEAGSVAGWDRADTASYYVGIAVVNHFTYCLLVEHWEDEVRTGLLNVQLLRPVHPLHRHVAEHVAERVIPGVVLLPVVVVVAVLVPGIRYTANPAIWVLVVASVVLGSALGFLIDAFFTTLAFWTTRVNNIGMLVWGMGTFVSGWVAPVSFFPPAVQRVAELLPFRTLVGFPVEMMVGKLSAGEIAFGFAVGGAWIVLLAMVYRTLWRLGVRRYEALGG